MYMMTAKMMIGFYRLEYVKKYCDTICSTPMWQECNSTSATIYVLVDVDDTLDSIFSSDALLYLLQRAISRYQVEDTGVVVPSKFESVASAHKTASGMSQRLSASRDRDVLKTMQGEDNRVRKLDYGYPVQ